MALPQKPRRGRVGPPDPARTVIINVQARISPSLIPAVIDAMAGGLQRHPHQPLPCSPRVLPDGGEKVHNPNLLVKTLFAADGRALYFLRSAIPHVRVFEASRLAPARPLTGAIVGSTGLSGPDVLARWLGPCPPPPLGADREAEQCV